MDSLKNIASDVSRTLFKGSLRRRITEQAKKDSLNAKSVLVIDTNLGFDHADALSQKMKTYFCIPIGESGFPLWQDHCTGYGFNKIIRIDEPQIALKDKMKRVIDEVDFVVVTDCYFGAMADDLREDGIDVCGASKALTKIENERVYGWQTLKDLGIGVPTGEIVHGDEEFENYVDKNAGEGKVFFSHFNKYRGNGETNSVMNKTQAKTMIHQSGYGPFVTNVEILVLNQCEGKELGIDAFFNGTDFLNLYLYTIEIKGAGTIGVWVEENSIKTLILDKIKPLLIESNYRGPISFEFFWNGGEDVQVHDPTCRFAFPCSTLWAKEIKNWPKVLYALASGKKIDIKVGKKYIAQIGRYTSDTKTWRPIQFPEEIRDRVGFRRIVIVDDDYYFVPGDEIVATACGSGDTPKEALDECIDVVSQIECSNSSFPGDLDRKMLAVIDEINSMESDLDMKF